MSQREPGRGKSPPFTRLILLQAQHFLSQLFRHTTRLGKITGDGGMVLGHWDNGMVEVGFNPGKLCKQSSIYIHLQ
jgi:hypothetical protein